MRFWRAGSFLCRVSYRDLIVAFELRYPHFAIIAINITRLLRPCTASRDSRRCHAPYARFLLGPMTSEDRRKQALPGLHKGPYKTLATIAANWARKNDRFRVPGSHMIGGCVSVLIVMGWGGGSGVAAAAVAMCDRDPPLVSSRFTNVRRNTFTSI